MWTEKNFGKNTIGDNFWKTNKKLELTHYGISNS